MKGGVPVALNEHLAGTIRVAGDMSRDDGMIAEKPLSDSLARNLDNESLVRSESRWPPRYLPIKQAVGVQKAAATVSRTIQLYTPGEFHNILPASILICSLPAPM